MQRRSYYPQQNPQLVSTVTATSSSGVPSSRPETPTTIIPGDDPKANAYGHKPSNEIHIEEEMGVHDIAMVDIHNEKAYAC